MSSIDKDYVALSQNWGVAFCDYTIDENPVDFQDLMVVVAEQRATSVEGEVAPLSTRIRDRNKTLDALGDALGDLTKIQSSFADNASGTTRSSIAIQDSTYDTLVKVFKHLDFSLKNMLKYEVEEWIQKVKSKIDALNNESQTDMTRLQSLVDRRDEAFSTASDLMSTISDTRSNLINNL